MSELEVRPEITAVFAHRKASSDCCGAGLGLPDSGRYYVCKDCGQPCNRVLSDPTEVTAHG
jgi:hypothetical protein